MKTLLPLTLFLLVSCNNTLKLLTKEQVVELTLCQKLDAAYTASSSTYCSLAQTLTDPTSSGSGTEADPYILCSPYQVNAISDTAALMSKSFKLNASMDMSCISGNHSSIGSVTNPYSGVFDGNNKTIKNWTRVAVGVDNVGFIGYGNPSGASMIKSITLSNATVQGNNYVGILVGAANFGYIIDSHTSGTVTGVNNVGGVIGGNVSGMYNLSSSATVIGAAAVGGILGSVSHTPVMSCYFTGSVSATGNNVGGLVGSSGGAISNSYSTGNVASTGTNVGGLGGTVGNYIKNSYATGSVTGTTKVGGLVGDSSSTVGGLINSFATGNVTGNGGTSANVGPLYGTSTGVTTNSYALATATCDADSATVGTQACNSGVTGTQANLSDFYSTATAPISSWDFQGESVNGTNDFWATKASGLPVVWYQDPQSFTAPFSGSGTEASPYLISSVSDFQLIGSNPRLMDSAFKLTSSLNFAAQTFYQIGSEEAIFTGSFDGDGYTLQNISFTKDGDFVGTFGYTAYATITNLNITSANFSTGRLFGGVLAGYTNGTISNCSTSGQVVTIYYTGGLVGFNIGLITQATSSATLPTTTSSGAGGLVGANFGQITKSSSSGTVTGAAGTGGLVGMNNGTIEDSFSTSAVTYTATGFPQNYGGLVGYLRSTGVIRRSYATGSVTGRARAGGLVGKSDASTTIINSFATGNITSNSNSASVGMLVGASAGTITHSYYLGTATCDANTGVGGIQACNTTATGSIAAMSDFYSVSTTPLDTWDFTSVWSSDAMSLPLLQ